jgi:hypothetical protein
MSCLSWQRSSAQIGGEEYFEETGHLVLGEFLTKFHSVPNPLQLYGYPITEAYLAKEYFFVMHEDPRRLRPEPGGNINNGTLSLRVHAYPTKAVTSRNGMQTIFVIVQDQRLLPVKDTQVTITLRMPAGDEIRHIVPILTDVNGVTQYTFPFNTNTVGIVQVSVTAVSNNLEAKTTTSFRAWW